MNHCLFFSSIGFSPVLALITPVKFKGQWRPQKDDEEERVLMNQARVLNRSSGRPWPRPCTMSMESLETPNPDVIHVRVVDPCILALLRIMGGMYDNVAAGEVSGGGQC